ncbi:hypothetical protein ACJMK2_000366 [Sinanodonta woodiana]|uniref:G-protein coupled receptors family 1 profile domain-containing protein n=1 Tax=Sinanodonta woodiana TaxID=1069815 RepID=A0ABD3XQT9_SINWO
MNNSSTSLLQKVNDEKAVHLIPAMVLVGVLMVIGLIGNIFVCYYYGWKTKTTPTSCFILCLAVFGLLNCIISMPMEIVDMRYFYMFPDVTVCKVLRATNFVCIFASGGILIAIATERYRRICFPFRKQITVCQSKLVCGTLALIACVLSCPSLVLYTVVTVDIPLSGSDTIQGYDCTTVKDVSLNVYLKAFNIMQILLFILSTMALIVLYALVYRRLIRQKNFKKFVLRGERVSPESPVVPNINKSLVKKSIKNEYTLNYCCKNTESRSSDTIKKAYSGSNSRNNIITQVTSNDTENEFLYRRVESIKLTENNSDNKHESTNRIAIEQTYNQVQLEKERDPLECIEHDIIDSTRQTFGMLTNDNVSPENDNVSPANDTVSQNYNVSQSNDYVNPANDNVSQSNDIFSQSNDNVIQSNDDVSPANDNVSPENDTVSPENDNVSPANVTVSQNYNVSQSNNYVSPSNDYVNPANDNVSQSNDIVSQANDNVIQSNDDVSPANDNISPANDNVSQSNDNASPANDNVSQSTYIVSQADNNVIQSNAGVCQANNNISPANDNVSQSNDNVSPANDNVSPASDTIPLRCLPSLSKKRSSDISTLRYTTLKFAITVTFIASFLPYLCLVLWRSLLTGYEVNQMTDLELIFFSIGIRSYFLNSAMNPIIYGFFNSQFREFFTRFCCACSGTNPN